MFRSGIGTRFLLLSYSRSRSQRGRGERSDGDGGLFGALFKFGWSLMKMEVNCALKLVTS